MNKELELEAENYVNQEGSIPTTELEDAIFKQGFIDGATSKYVEKQKLKFAIEQLNELEFDPKENILDFVIHIKNKVKELEQQLKQLENEKNINN